MPRSPSSPIGISDNLLLSALAPDLLDRLTPHLQTVQLSTRQILQERSRPIAFIYFVTSGLISLVISFADGFQAEAALVGREGLVGVPVLHGVGTAAADAVAHSSGEALRLPVGPFREALRAQPTLGAGLLRYSEALRSQTMQIAACNGRHNLEQRLSRWLLMVHDRSDANVLPVTQELLAMILCVHRPSVTVVAGRLQRAGLIRYSSGQIEVADRAGLELAACECYAMMRHRERQLR